MRCGLGWGFVVAAFAWAVTTTCHADWIVFRDGTKVQGSVLLQDSEKIIAEVLESGVRSTKTFSAADVESVLKWPLPANFFETGEKATQPKATDAHGTPKAEKTSKR